MSAHGGEPPSVSVSIFARARDAECGAELAAQLEGAPVRVCRVEDAGVDGLGAADVWRPWTRRATHHLVLDAAVRPHPQLLRQVRDAVAAQPSALLSFFTPGDDHGSHVVRVAAFAGRPWAVPPGAGPSPVATILPSREAAVFARSLETRSGSGDGEGLRRFARARGLARFASNPALVRLGPADPHPGATAFLPAEEAPAAWWRGEPLTTLASIPSVHLRDGEPVSWEVVEGAAETWRVRARREMPAPHARRLARLIRERLLSADVARSDVRAAAALLGVGGVLRDQLVLAARVGRPSDGFGEAVARESAATLPVATLWHAIPAAVRPGGAAEVRDVFQALHDEMAVILRRSLPAPPRGADP